MTTSTTLLQTRLFAELGGYCVLDIAGTLSCWVPEGSGFPVDLLAKLAVEEEVERMAARGALLPIVVDEPDDYLISVRLDAATGPGFDELLGDERGWSFRAGPDGQHMVGIGYLLRWSPNEPDFASFHLPEGEHDVRCRWGLRGDQRCIDLVFVPQPAPATPASGRAPPIEVSFPMGG